MDDTSLQELENELKALRPRRPSVLLRARVEHDLSQSAAPAPATPAARPTAPRYASASTLRSWKWISWQTAAAAAVVFTASFALWRNLTPRPAPIRPVQPVEIAQTPVAAELQRDASRELTPVEQRALAVRNAYRPVKAANVLYDLQDEGPVTLEDNTLARRVRARYVDTYTWKNPTTNASLKWSVPRDEVRMLPASFQ